MFTSIRSIVLSKEQRRETDSQPALSPATRRPRKGRLAARLLLAYLLALSLTTTLKTLAQSPALTIQSLAVEIWPDYDRPEVLVLLKGVLPAGVPLPATITLPLPADATLNAVARETAQGALLSDIDYDDSKPGQITLTTPESRFRVEYYYPYTLDGDERALSFDWQSDLTVDDFQVRVQQPIMATSFRVDPTAIDVSTGADGLTYHFLPPQGLAAGERFALESSYALPGSQLTVDQLPSEVPLTSGATVSGPEATVATDTSFNWLIAIAAMGAILAVVAGVWLALSRRTVKRVVKPRPVRSSQKGPPATRGTVSAAKYCHECGRPTSPGDRFCANCGTALKVSD